MRFPSIPPDRRQRWVAANPLRYALLAAAFFAIVTFSVAATHHGGTRGWFVASGVTVFAGVTALLSGLWGRRRVQKYDAFSAD